MTILNWLFDGILALSLFIVAWQSLTVPDLFRATQLFIAFGILMALTCARLFAPDVALAQLAIGVGLTGILLFNTLHNFDHNNESK
jgi:uncharacterized MnhB-related membrane protein